MNPPVTGMIQRPWGEEYMAPAFMGLVSFNLNHANALDSFKKESGKDMRWLMNRTELDKKVDEATGFEESLFAEFCDWVALTQWGIEGAD